MKGMHYPLSAFLEKAPKNRGWRVGAGQTSGSLSCPAAL
jgi:hypothetical protein